MGHIADIRDELGDLLLQVVFQAQMFSEPAFGKDQTFDFDDVVNGLAHKLLRVLVRLRDEVRRVLLFLKARCM